ncbi:Gamma-tubulin complex component 3-like protein [Triticum urartu]|uniref:Gamma-tubulin complex component n=1 Tax=Triticum urartu TaxID=4572 RepID=M7Z487_TRIUA|nr:Gamma-tubulin complex component 3-like protein [Triticum urartu]
MGDGMDGGHEKNGASGGNEANYGNTMFQGMETMEAQVPMKGMKIERLCTLFNAILFVLDPDNIREIALREYTELVLDETEVSEATLVRDVLYACQGIDGRYVRYDKASDTYDLPAGVRVPGSTRTLVRKLCEVGWLFRKVRGFVSDNVSRLPSHAATEVGTVAQAFCSALQEELSDYYKLLAVLESYSLHPIPTPGSDSGVSGNYLSLRRLVVWLAEPAVKMRLMAVLVDGCRGLRGGGMAGAIHGHAQHGDPMVQDFMGRLLRRVCSPLFEMVRSWVLEGELEDVFGEFFIVGQPVKAESLWREGYLIQSDMLPSFISPVLAQRILRTGKSINFLRVCCDDNGWAEAATEAAAYVGTTTSRGGLGYGQIDALEALVVEAAKRIDQRLMDVIHKRYRFKDHCLAIKRYLLLGQGDFVQYLMDVVGPELSEPANRISSFHLAGLLETAIRASDAQYDDRDILDRIRVKMMDHGDGDRGWDVFSLEYDARVPLDTVFTASVMKMYLKIFNFLWKLKRVDHSLTGVWKTMKPNCIVSSPFYKEGTSIRAQFVSVLRKCQVLFNEMNHFVTNFQYYIMFEVLEVSWARFSEEMDAAKDLDDLLMGHDKYLTSIVEKSLLGERSLGILRNLFALFDIILQFRSHADRWFERIYELQLRGKSKLKTKSKETGFEFVFGSCFTKDCCHREQQKIRAKFNNIVKAFNTYMDSVDPFLERVEEAGRQLAGDGASPPDPSAAVTTKTTSRASAMSKKSEG